MKVAGDEPEADATTWYDPSMLLGAAVTAAKYGLTPAQATRYVGLSSVSAHPIQDARERPIGVLVFLTNLPDDQSKIGDPDFIVLNAGWAEALAHILVSIVGIVGDD